MGEFVLDGVNSEQGQLSAERVCEDGEVGKVMENLTQKVKPCNTPMPNLQSGTQQHSATFPEPKSDNVKKMYLLGELAVAADKLETSLGELCESYGLDDLNNIPKDFLSYLTTTFEDILKMDNPSSQDATLPFSPAPPVPKLASATSGDCSVAQEKGYLLGELAVVADKLGTSLSELCEHYGLDDLNSLPPKFINYILDDMKDNLENFVEETKQQIKGNVNKENVKNVYQSK